MANIGATTAFYKVETSLTRANNEVSKSMERLATGKQNANAGDRSSYVAMADTFRLDYVGTKAGIKGASVAMGYLETGMRVLDAASSLLSRLQELAVLGANNTNTNADNEAINLEAEAIADEFNRLMTTSTYKGKDVFVTNANDQELAMGGRGSEMTFGIGRIAYTDLYSSSNRTITGEPNGGETFNLMHLPSDAIVAKSYGAAITVPDATSGTTLAENKKYVIRNVSSDDEIAMNDATDAPSSTSIATHVSNSNLTIKDSTGADVTSSNPLAFGQVIDVSSNSAVTSVNAEGIIVNDAKTASAQDGEVAAVAITTGTTVGDRIMGTYTVTVSNSGSTDTATFEIDINEAGVATGISVVDGGSGFTTTDTVTVTNATLGGTGASLVFDVSTVTDKADRDTGTTKTIGASDYTVLDSTGVVKTSASGATFSLQIDANGDINVIGVTAGGSGFAATDQIVIQGSVLSSTGNPSDTIITAGTVTDSKDTSVTFAEVNTGSNAFRSEETYVIQSLGTTNSNGTIASGTESDALIISRAFTDVSGNQLTGNLSVGQKIKMASIGTEIGGVAVTQQHLDAANALVEDMTFTLSTDTLTSDIETIQSLVNRARVEAGSQYAAMESAVSYTTDLTAQYELGFNSVNDVNFSAETAHLAKKPNFAASCDCDAGPGKLRSARIASANSGLISQL
jgi:flagellin